jgi:hypothetical protein
MGEHDGRVPAEGPPYFLKPWQVQAVLRAQWEARRPTLKVKRRRDHARFPRPDYEYTDEYHAWQQDGLANGWLYALDDVQSRDTERWMHGPPAWQRDWARKRKARKRNRGRR